MNSIKLEKWGSFKIGDLFDIHPTKSYKANNSVLMQKDGINEVVVNSSFNNGVGGYTNLENTEKGNIITFSDTTTADSVFYHENPFVGYSHIQGLYPKGKYKDEWSKYSYLFFATIFRNKAINSNFDYVNKFTRETAKDIVVKLPVTELNDIDFEYMENYMRIIENKSIATIKKLSEESKSKKCNSKIWKRFHLYDLFDIDSGTKLDRIAMKYENPTINFVGRSGINNGVTCIVDEIENIEPYEPGCLTLALGGAYLGSCFVQNKPFYTSQNVVVLKPKFDMTMSTKQFICTMIFKEGNTYYKAFIDELNRHIKTDFSILLPVNQQNNIDFEYINSFITILQEKSKLNISVLGEV